MVFSPLPGSMTSGHKTVGGPEQASFLAWPGQQLTRSRTQPTWAWEMHHNMTPTPPPHLHPSTILCSSALLAQLEGPLVLSSRQSKGTLTAGESGRARVLACKDMGKMTMKMGGY